MHSLSLDRRGRTSPQVFTCSLQEVAFARTLSLIALPAPARLDQIDDAFAVDRWISVVC